MESILATGAVFTAKTKLGTVIQYEFVGIDLADLADGIGCHYVVLRNLADNTITRVEAAWFCTALTERIIEFPAK